MEAAACKAKSFTKSGETNRERKQSMSENKVSGLLESSMEKIKQMVDVNTVVGDPITTPDGTTVIRICT